MNRAGCAAIVCAGLWLVPPCPAGVVADEEAPGVSASERAPAQQMRLGDLAARARTGGDVRSAPPAGSGSVQSMLGLGIVLTLILVGAGGLRWLARRQGGLMASIGPGGRAPAGLLEVLGRYPVARGQTLVLIKLDRRVLLLSQSSAGRSGAGEFSTLSEITDPDEVASILLKTREEAGDTISHRFKSFLAGEEARPWEGGLGPPVDPDWHGGYGGSDAPEDDRAATRYTGVGLLRERVESLRRGAEGGVP